MANLSRGLSVCLLDSAELWNGKTIAIHTDTFAHLRFGKALATLPDTSIQLEHGKALTLPIRSLDFACAKAWQTFAPITLSVHLVRSSKTRLGLSPHARSTLRDQAANTTLTHALQKPGHRSTNSDNMNSDHDMLRQCSIQSTYDSLYGLATTSTPPPVNQMYFKNRDIDLPTSTTSATRIDHLAASLRLQPTPASRIEHLAAVLRLRPYQLPTSTIC